MGKTTGITWTDATWNPWRGCKKVSAGCKNCYMFRDAVRYGQDPNQIVRSKTTFEDPLKWAGARKIFVCSWSDFFLREADPWRAEAWEIIRRSPQHTFQLCTKRPERIRECLPTDWGDGYRNVWLGVTAESQAMARRRLPILLDTPARVRWVSIEPMLEAMDLENVIYGEFENAVAVDVLGGCWVLEEEPPTQERLDWVVMGGESGDRTHPARLFKPDWARRLVDQCQRKGVPVFVKQMGSAPVGLALKDRHGAEPAEWPADLRVQEFPR